MITTENSDPPVFKPCPECIIRLMRLTTPHLAIALALIGAPVAARAQMPVDSGLARYIATIRAIDNHAHPMRPVPPGAPADSEFDALPLDGIPPFPIPWRLTLDAHHAPTPALRAPRSTPATQRDRECPP